MEYVNIGSDLQNMKIEFDVCVTVHHRYNNMWYKALTMLPVGSIVSALYHKL